MAAIQGSAIRTLWQRRDGWVLIPAVVIAHLVLVDQLAHDRFGWGRAERVPPRIEVAFVKELEQTAPAATPPLGAAVPATRVPAVRRAASAPLHVASAPAGPAAPMPAPVSASVPDAPQLVEAPTMAQVQAPEQVPAAPEPAAPASSVPSTAQVAPSKPQEALTPALVDRAASAHVPPQAAFEWPPSTRLTYTLNGYFRGPIEGGSAQVEWLRSGSRYQVHLETRLAPLLTRRITSDGELTEHGLQPRRFDAEQKVLFKAPRRWTLLFGPQRITLVDGREIDAVAGVQDEASQFVQLTWLFTTQPDKMRVGQSIEVPLVLNRRLDRWIYDVKEMQTLYLPFGEVPTYYVKPRREARGGDMTAEIWFAPTLQYLPVRIVIRQDQDTFVELTLDRPPLQAAPDGASR
ncbi:MAG: DUF3108 domain-containing protein [Aquabacterium sp.]|jgi:hypothetical protein|nr:DUF3108 domain-containing protein [Aquabacterium sp.]